jgi:hypothetical protein
LLIRAADPPEINAPVAAPDTAPDAAPDVLFTGGEAIPLKCSKNNSAEPYILFFLFYYIIILKC